MFLGAYRFAGDPAELLAGYDRLMAGFPPGAISVHVCVADENGMTVFDACPTREVFLEFSSGSNFAAAVAAAGLPVPSVQPLGEIHVARLGDGVMGASAP
jgi:hypothetical protein